MLALHGFCGALGLQVAFQQPLMAILFRRHDRMDLASLGQRYACALAPLRCRARAKVTQEVRELGGG